MAMTPASQGCVFHPADPVVLHSNAGSMVHRVGETLMAGLSSDHNQALARPPGYGRDTRQAAQRGVVTSLQGIKAFCEQRGENDPSDARQGCQDLHIMLLLVPRLSLLVEGEPRGQGIEAFM